MFPLSAEEKQQLHMNSSDVDAKTVMDKLRANLAIVGAQNPGLSRSVETLIQSGSVVPSANMPKSAAQEIIANMLVDKQQNIDREHYARDSRFIHRMPQFLDPRSVDREFRNTDYTSEKYQSDKAILKEMIMNQPQLVEHLISGKADRNELAYIENSHPGISRYFLNR
jgi:hypothetical protein